MVLPYKFRLYFKWKPVLTLYLKSRKRENSLFFISPDNSESTLIFSTRDNCLTGEADWFRLCFKATRVCGCEHLCGYLEAKLALSALCCGPSNGCLQLPWALSDLLLVSLPLVQLYIFKCDRLLPRFKVSPFILLQCLSLMLSSSLSFLLLLLLLVVV